MINFVSKKDLQTKIESGAIPTQLSVWRNGKKETPKYRIYLKERGAEEAIMYTCVLDTSAESDAFIDSIAVHVNKYYEDSYGEGRFPRLARPYPIHGGWR
ncbi:hypothetical protein RYA05_01110 [Pseudomonas syringae pv. actinidiae]|nr:hypothetical protein [Pseudomonas syringae pv. actinidiae]